jgi:hypothetical protein
LEEDCFSRLLSSDAILFESKPLVQCIRPTILYKSSDIPLNDDVVPIIPYLLFPEENKVEGLLSAEVDQSVALNIASSNIVQSSILAVRAASDPVLLLGIDLFPICFDEADTVLGGEELLLFDNSVTLLNDSKFSTSVHIFPPFFDKIYPLTVMAFYSFFTLYYHIHTLLIFHSFE